MNGLEQRLGLRLGRSLDGLARWWSSASKEARFALLLAASKKDPQAPSLEEVRIAALAAEWAAREISEG